MKDPSASTSQSTLDALPWPVFSVDRELRYLTFNRAHADAMRLLYGAEIEIGGILPEYMTVDADRIAALLNLHSVLTGATVEADAWSGEVGRRRLFSVTHTALRDGDEVVGVAVIAPDITGRHYASTTVRETSDLLRSIIEGTSDSVFVKDTEGRYVLANAAMLHRVGKRLDEVLGVDDTALFPREEALAIMERDRQVLNSSGPVTFEEVATAAGGELHSFLSTKGPVRGADGELVGLFGIVRDITERTHAENALRGLVEDLRRSNQDLEQFAYAVSHDLQEPLRMVASYTELLRRRYADRLDADADDFIDFAVDGAHRMQRMIDGLLEFSRVGTRGQTMIPVAGRAVVDAALANLRGVIEESGAVVEVGELPVLTVDAEQLAHVFQNLIGNAIKFQAPGNTPRVSISARSEDGEWRFSVRDNGIGIDPKFVERVFVVFQRLHSRDAFPGTGIGLAICRRVVERHGGHIWVESVPDQGSEFVFTLPIAEAPQEPGGNEREVAR